MTKTTLYLMVGYPGAGKTTVSHIIAELTGAEHLWADHERKKMFDPVTHSYSESQKLYNYLNNLTDRLLSQGKSVIFDTNFNFYKDRQKLRQIAAKNGAETKLIWLTTPEDIAKQRALTETEVNHTRVLGTMPENEFDRMAGNLQPPRDGEDPIKVNGTNLNIDELKQALNL
jgi:predicted kinase